MELIIQIPAWDEAAHLVGALATMKEAQALYLSRGFTNTLRT